jgi:hypothetical protein
MTAILAWRSIQRHIDCQNPVAHRGVRATSTVIKLTDSDKTM